VNEDELVYQATHTAYCAGFVVRDNRVVAAAPIIARKIITLPACAAIAILVRAGARIEHVYTAGTPALKGTR
jgi:hypothetical protein